MKSSLVTATSVAAVLAFEAGPTMAGPVVDLSVSSTQSTCDNIASPSTCTLDLYALPGKGAAGQTVTLKNVSGSAITGTQTFQTAPTGFTGAVAQNKATVQPNGTFTSNTYGFTGAASAGSLGETTTSTGAANLIVGSGGKNGNAPQTSVLTFNGITVSPIQSVSSKDAGFVLVGTSGTASVTVQNTGHGNLANGGKPSIGTNLNGSVGAGNSVFVGSGGSVNLADGASTTFNYTFTPTKQGSSSSVGITTTFTNGSPDGKNTAGSPVTSTLNGTGVAPVQQVTTGSSVFARAGGPSTTSTVTVTNTGNGNLATGGPNSKSNLNGTIGAITGSTNWSGGPTTFSVQDATSPGSNANTFSYTYAPGATRGGPNTGNVSVAFSNGNSDLSNTAQTVPVSLTGSTVGPVYHSEWPGSTNNTPVKNGGTTPTIDFGTVATKGSQLLTLANISTDANGGNSGLTDLTVENFSITGKNSTNFNISGKQSGTPAVTVLHEGDSEVIDIGFSAVTKGTYNALLTFNTDEGGPLGGVGNFYVYSLTAVAQGAVPEPASLLLLSVGLGGALLVRRSRRLT